MAQDKYPVAVIGGTGNLGRGLAAAWARAGYPVFVGSRDAARAAAAAGEIEAAGGQGNVRGVTNAQAAKAAEVVVVTVPFASQAAILQSIAPHLAGKLVVDTTVPLAPPKVARVQLPEAGSAAMTARRLLGEGARLVSAFHNVAAHKLQRSEEADCDVLVFGDEPADRDIVVGLAKAAGLRGVHAGPLANSVAAEALTSVLIGINRRYKVDGAGLRITGLAGS